MRSSSFLPALILALLFGSGCTTPTLQIHRDARDDFSTYRTWSWVPDSPRTIDAPPPYRVGLDHQLARLVAREMARRGFEQVSQHGDLRVGAILNVRRESRQIVETSAIQQLTSYTSDGAYEIQGSTVRLATLERARIAVFAIRPRDGVVVWKGSLERTFDAGSSLGVGTLARSLFENFPRCRFGDGTPSEPVQVARPDAAPRHADPPQDGGS